MASRARRAKSCSAVGAEICFVGYGPMLAEISGTDLLVVGHVLHQWWAKWRVRHFRSFLASSDTA